jgi:hypothetical protein
MLYGSLYKVFLKLSKQKNNNNNKKEYNELTIPKIFVKILLNNERKRTKNYFKLEVDNTDNYIKELQEFDINNIKNNKEKEKENHNSLIKNHSIINKLDYTLPKIRFKKSLDLKLKKENSKNKEKSDILKQIKSYEKSNINNFRKTIFKKFNENNINNSNNNNNKEVKICNLKYKVKLNNFFEYKELESEIFDKDKELEKDNKTKIENYTYNKNIMNIRDKNNILKYIERNKKKSFLKIYSPENKINILKINKKSIFEKQKDELIITNNIHKKYSKLEDINEILSKKEINYLLNKNNLINNDIYYYKLGKMYRNQLKEYFSHRINWCLISNNNNETINFEWKYFSNKINYKEYKYDSTIPIKKLKMINLFEKNYEIGNKKYMFLNLIKYCDKENINVFEIVPFTIIINNSNNIDDSLDKIKKIMNLIEKNKLSNKDLISNQKYNEIFDDDKFYESLKNQYIYINKNFLSLKNYWIIKPTDLYQGKCIEICNSFDDLVKISKKIFKGVNQKLIPEQLNITTNIEDNNDIIDNNNSTEKLITLNNIHNNNIKKKIIKTRMYCTNEIIVQKYLDNPLLYKNRKFDIRCFVLLDSNFNLYFCKEGHLKGSSELYNLNNSNKFIHITNYSLQKNSNKFELYEIGNEMSYKDFKNYLINENISLDKFDYMINQMKLLIKISFKSVSKKLLKNKKNILCFEIFGYDFILDNDFKLWILEINNNPGLSISSPVIEKLVPRMMDDAFRLTLDKVFNTKYSNECIDINGEYKTKYKLNGFSDNENIFEFLCNIS